MFLCVVCCVCQWSLVDWFSNKWMDGWILKFSISNKKAQLSLGRRRAAVSVAIFTLKSSKVNDFHVIWNSICDLIPTITGYYYCSIINSKRPIAHTVQPQCIRDRQTSGRQSCHRRDLQHSCRALKSKKKLPNQMHHKFTTASLDKYNFQAQRRAARFCSCSAVQWTFQNFGIREREIEAIR